MTKICTKWNEWKYLLNEKKSEMNSDVCLAYEFGTLNCTKNGRTNTLRRRPSKYN